MRRLVSEWSPAEDLRPAQGVSEPEVTSRGKVWRQVAYFEWDGLPSYTQIIIREVGDQTFVDHGRVWPVAEDDGA